MDNRWLKLKKIKQLQMQREGPEEEREQKVKETEKKRHEESVQSVCPECGSRQLVHDYERAELVCQSCGLVLMRSSSTAVPSGVLSTTTSA